MWILILFLVSVSFSVCPGTLNVSLEMSSETVEKVGKSFRRADVLVFIPVEKKLLKKEVNVLESEHEVYKVGEKLFHIDVHIRNRTSVVSDNAVLEQPVSEGSDIEGSIQAKRIISKSPLIFEPLNLYPTDIKPGKIIIKLPTVKPGEELELSYKVKGRPGDPVVKSSKKLEVEDDERLYMLVAKYSILFGYGKTDTEDINLRNLKEIVKGFKMAGLKPVVKIVGVADGKTTDIKRNKEVAQARARFVARELLGENFACYIRRAYADLRRERQVSLTGTPF